MLRLGIIGYPLTHTLSPYIHNIALQYLNIDGEYKAYEIKKEGELEKIFSNLKELGLRGFNVTIPYKQKVIPLIDNLSETAKLCNAVNTVTILESKKTIGDNTDVIGFWESIPEKIRKDSPDKEIAIIGCGGAARACVIALILNGVNKIKVYGRNKEKLTAFQNFIESRKVETLCRSVSTTKIEADLINNLDLKDTFMLVNTTPIGMYPNIIDSVVSIDNLKKLPIDAIVYDLIYNPQETKLLKDAKSLGLKTLNGIEMLVRQGALSLQIWLNQKEPPIGAMRLAMNQAISFKLKSYSL